MKMGGWRNLSACSMSCTLTMKTFWFRENFDQTQGLTVPATNDNQHFSHLIHDRSRWSRTSRTSTPLSGSRSWWTSSEIVCCIVNFGYFSTVLKDFASEKSWNFWLEGGTLDTLSFIQIMLKSCRCAVELKLQSRRHVQMYFSIKTKTLLRLAALDDSNSKFDF